MRTELRIRIATAVAMALLCLGLVNCKDTAGAAPPDLGMSVPEAVRHTILRLKEEQPPEQLLSIKRERVAELLTDEERAALGRGHLSFRVDVPVVVYVVTDPELEGGPFWLKDQGFEAAKGSVVVNRERRELWCKDFPAGPVGLGVNSLTDDGDHYFVVVARQDSASAVKVTGVTPPLHTVAVARRGEYVLTDEDDERISRLPKELEGNTLIRGRGDREEVAHIAGFFRRTKYAATARPDQVVTTMAADPEMSMNVQWRTSTDVAKGVVYYHEKGSSDTLEAEAETTVIEDIGLLLDPVVHRHVVTLTDLKPGATYVYRVGDGTESNRSEPEEFTTAPAQPAPFSFLYMGDIQQGYDQWAAIRDQALKTCPDAAFCLSAGDQANRGGFRDDWDAFFHYGSELFADVPLVPVVGNHELYRNEPKLYLELFHLPHNGPANITPERAYAFEYGQVLVVCLDSNLPVEGQAPWLEEQLASSDAVWKFVMNHQPSYSSKPNRDNPGVRKVWGDVFDKYDVDVVFQGHDHGYLRTYPMEGGKRAGAPDDGIIYLVSVSGAKLYDVDARNYGEVAFGRTPTFQVIDIETNPDRLVYRAYDKDAKVLDEFVLEK